MDLPAIIRSSGMNKKIDKIMACIDFSEYSLMVLEYAVELATSSDTKILVYNVVNQSNYYTMAAVSMYAQIQVLDENETRELKQGRLGWMKELIAEHFPGEKLNLQFKIDVGFPSEKILETIESEDIDLVVMANKGRGNIARFFLGSSAENVFRHSPVPVVSVRDRKRFQRHP
jgi:nucleotide-binding universal stress UspA family protein